MNCKPGIRLLKLSLWACLLLPNAGLMAQEENNNLPIRVKQGAEVAGNLFGFLRDVVVDGKLTGDVTALDGDVQVKGTIEGDISVWGGDVRLLPDASVKGNIVCIGGKVDRMPGAKTEGRVHSFLARDQKTANPWNTAKSRLSYFFSQSLMMFLLVVLTFYIFPNQINEASFELVQDPIKPAVIGFFTLAAFFAALFLSFLLMVVGIGFPLFLLFACGLMVVVTFGAVVVFYRLGQMLEGLTGNLLSLTSGVLVAVVAFGLIIRIPLVGSLVSFVLLTFGSGIVIATRFGTNKQWFTRRARFWSAN